MASDELARKLQHRMAAEQAPLFNPCAPEETPLKPSDSVPEPQEKAVVVIVNDATSELTAKLTRRLDINDGNAAPKQAKVFNPYTEFKEFSRKQIKDMENIFKRFDSGKDGFIDLMELKLMMEKLGAPQTHLGLKNMIREVDEDFDSKLSYREVSPPQHDAATPVLHVWDGVLRLANLIVCCMVQVQALKVGSKFEAEIREEQEERKRQALDRKQRRAAFKELQSAFCS
uniref:EF-hand domain family, member D1 n=1 Tax=Hucho hucho TaxID=62062 RepID=A0A4W5P0M3_9TELE